MLQYITGFNGIDLRVACGLYTPGASGILSAPKPALRTTWLPGGIVAHVKVERREMRTVKFGAVMHATTHEDLVDNMQALVSILLVDDDFHPLVVSNRPTQRVMALCMGFDVAAKELPGLTDVYTFDIPFMCYPYWEDLTERTVTITGAFLGFRQATFEHTSLDGWAAYDTGTATVETTDPHAGSRCMKVVCLGDDGAETPEHGIAGVTAAADYSLQAYMKGAAGGETVTAAIRWYDGDDLYLSESTEAWELTAEWALYKAEGKEAPAGAVSASLRITDAHASTFYVDDVCLEEAATCGDFITPYDANTVVVNNGRLTAYPTWTLTILDTLADGLTFEVNGVEFAYEGALAGSDALVVETDQQMPDVELNDVRDWANVTSDPVMPTLSVGSNAVVLSDPTKVRLVGAYRERTW